MTVPTQRSLPHSPLFPKITRKQSSFPTHSIHRNNSIHRTNGHYRISISVHSFPSCPLRIPNFYANMHQHAVAGTAAIALITPFLILLGATESNAQACAAGTAQEINGNWYCSEVNAISYTNFPGNGSYNKVTNMDAATGQCSFEQYGYSGNLSPLNEEVGAAER